MTSCGIDLSKNFVKLKGHISSKALSKVHYNQKASGHFAIPNIPRTISSKAWINIFGSLQWRHNGRDCVSNYRRLDCLLSRLFRRRSKKTSKLRVTGLYGVNSPVAGEFPAQRTSDAENASIWWRHHMRVHISHTGGPWLPPSFFNEM